ncbi:MAG TPA: HlyD family efflux transporter periplasmic adaptor subunit [Chthoniobacterales bacterium]|nr:HlyD family efflux transporter periplasmic adaptor subunit [Chthoniobacterales bacterium]
MTRSAANKDTAIAQPGSFSPVLSAMDVARPDLALKKRKRRVVIISAVAFGVILVTAGLSRLKPGVPILDRTTVWIDTVKRGPMVREVRGLGTLVPEQIRWLASNVDARVDRIILRPGAKVEPDTIILELNSPELEQAANDAQSKAKALEADLTSLRATLQRTLLDQESTTAKVHSEYEQAKMERQTNDQLAKNGLVADLIYKTSQVKEAELTKRDEIEQKRLAFLRDSIEPQLASKQAEVDQANQLAKLKSDEVEALQVRAGISGVLQQLPLEVGQRVTAGTNLARVADPTSLKAQLKIPETQAKDIQLDEQAVIDTRNGTVKGHVTRVDSAVEQGTVTVDVAFDETLPKGARPDLSVDGIVELERLDNVTYVGRPTFGQENTTVGIFKLVTGSNDAVRTSVKLGRSSATAIEVLSGLKPGDQVILSDTSAWSESQRVRLK